MANNLATNFPRAGNPRVSNFYEKRPLVVGDIFYVDSVNGTSSGPGYSPESAYATVAQALAACNASSHAHIFCVPWHAESIGAAGLAWNKAGVTIEGLGEGNLRPTFTWHTTDAVVTVSGANTTIRNIRTTVDIDEVVSMFNITGAGVTFDKVDYIDAGATQALQWLITTAAADQLTIKNCFHVQGTAAATAQKWIQLVGPDHTRILDNTFMILAAASTNSNLIHGSTAPVYLEISRNKCYFFGATVTSVILMATGTTGMITDNRLMSGTSVTTASAITCDACGLSENYWLDDSLGSGILAPAAGTD